MMIQNVIQNPGSCFLSRPLFLCLLLVLLTAGMGQNPEHSDDTEETTRQTERTSTNTDLIPSGNDVIRTRNGRLLAGEIRRTGLTSIELVLNGDGPVLSLDWNRLPPGERLRLYRRYRLPEELSTPEITGVRITLENERELTGIITGEDEQNLTVNTREETEYISRDFIVDRENVSLNPVPYLGQAPYYRRRRRELLREHGFNTENEQQDDEESRSDSGNDNQENSDAEQEDAGNDSESGDDLWENGNDNGEGENNDGNQQSSEESTPDDASNQAGPPPGELPPELHMELGMVATRMELYDRALSHFRHAARNDQFRTAANLRMEIIQRWQKELPALYLLEEARHLAGEREFESARERLRQLMEEYPESDVVPEAEALLSEIENE